MIACICKTKYAPISFMDARWMFEESKHWMRPQLGGALWDSATATCVRIHVYERGMHTLLNLWWKSVCYNSGSYEIDKSVFNGKHSEDKDVNFHTCVLSLEINQTDQFRGVQRMYNSVICNTVGWSNWLVKMFAFSDYKEAFRISPMPNRQQGGLVKGISLERRILRATSLECVWKNKLVHPSIMTLIG